MRGKYYTLLSLFPLTIMLLYYVHIYKIICIYEVCIKPVGSIMYDIVYVFVVEKIN